MAAHETTLVMPREARGVPVAEWSALFDHSPMAIAYLSQDLRLLRVNGAFAALRGRMAGELLGRRCYEVLAGRPADGSPGGGPCPTCRVPECLWTGAAQRFEVSCGERQLSIAASPVRLAAGAAQQVIITASDLASEQELRRQLLHSQKLAAVGMMTSGVLHEIKNPLTSIGGFAQLLRGRSDLPPEAMEHIETIWTQAQRCERIIRGLLKFTRKRDAGKTVVDVNTVVSEVLDLLHYHFAASAIAIREHYHPMPALVFGDCQELQQVVQNIASNAFDAMRDAHGGGTLTVATREEQGWVFIDLENDGPKLEEPEKILQPFHTTKEEGTGLGLCISDGIVRNHGGTLRAMNTPAGVLFSVCLPAARPERETLGPAREDGEVARAPDEACQADPT